MKKVLLIILVFIPLFASLVSCSNDSDNMFLHMVHASKKSTYECIKYIGTYEGNNYILTKNKGIFSFKFDDDFNAKNDSIEYLAVDGLRAPRNAYINGCDLYVLDAFGIINKIDLSKTTFEASRYTETTYNNLSKNGLAVDKTKNLVKLPYDSKATVTDLNISDVEKIFEVENTDYVFTKNELYKVTAEIEVNEINLNGISVASICNIVSDYAVIKNNDEYTIHRIESNSISNNMISGCTLSAKPTASFEYGDYVAFKTSQTIDLFDKNTSNLTNNYQDSWAQDLYTPTTGISEIVKIGTIDYYFSINETGGIIRIDTEGGNATSIFSE